MSVDDGWLCPIDAGFSLSAAECAVVDASLTFKTPMPAAQRNLDTSFGSARGRGIAPSHAGALDNRGWCMSSETPPAACENGCLLPYSAWLRCSALLLQRCGSAGCASSASVHSRDKLGGRGISSSEAGSQTSESSCKCSVSPSSYLTMYIHYTIGQTWVRAV
eukprot:363291-Chlamydomonas_euryale.AAC.27